MITLAFASLSEKFPNYELFKRHNTQKDKFIKFEGTEKEKEINEFIWRRIKDAKSCRKRSKRRIEQRIEAQKKKKLTNSKNNTTEVKFDSKIKIN